MTIRDRLGDASPPLARYRFDSPLVIYGAGGAGRSVAHNLASHGVRPSSFIDAAAGENDVRDGLSVFTLSRWLAKFDPSRFDVLISLHNPEHSVASVFDELTASGFARVLTMVDYVNSVEDNEFRYWLGPADFYRDKADLIESAAMLFADDTSLSWFEASLRLRLLGDYHSLPAPSRSDIYASTDLARWQNPMRLLDCGAFDGDTIDGFTRLGYSFDSLIGFEPDANNYQQLAARWSQLNATFLPCAVSDVAKKVSFASGLGKSSRIDASQGDEFVQCVGIDQALPNFRPTLIKLEVEGEELPVLKGALNTLERYRPGLAIGAYHLPEHLWELSLFIESLKLGYNFFLRGHAHNNYALILYCVPR